MEDMERYNAMNKCITSVESFFDVFNVVAKHGLFGEIKSTSMSHLLMEMGERLETIKTLNNETFDRIKMLTGSN
mgnify:CR=1 FL=1